ncbi:hypothetical protein RND81_08G176400 [Saponaria officinalis]|uniref:Dirigent protein n=1 Tax=Saponaria officinalis TaxID=3572 RepID=A0AAW1J904_SAPOF
MTNFFSLPTIPLLLLLVLGLGFTTPSRILDDVTPQSPYSLPPLSPVADSINVLPSAHAPALDTGLPVDQSDQPQPSPDETSTLPGAQAPMDTDTSMDDSPADQPDGPQSNPDDTTSPLTAPGPYPVPTAPLPSDPTPSSGGLDHPAISFYMHDVLGRSQTANNNNNNQAIVTLGQLPSGVPLQNHMFESITAIDEELTDSPELGSSVVGKGQGFYLASSLDGESHTMAFTALLDIDQSHVDAEDNTLTFFGVHQTATPVSRISIVGGTGVYENAKGYATIETLPQQDQYTTDGIDSIAHISVYIY